MLHVGGCIGYWQGDVRKMIDDVGALRPTLFAGVPRVFERIYNGVQVRCGEVSSGRGWGGGATPRGGGIYPRIAGAARERGPAGRGAGGGSGMEWGPPATACR